jgi:NADH-quinone oxidoreductase subunit N
MGLLLRVVFGSFGAVQSNWTALVALLSALTMLYGSLMALRQRSVRRLFAHLALANLGVILMGMLGAQQNSGVSTVMFSLVAAGFATIAGGAAITLVEGSGAADSLAAYQGLSRRSPGVASVLSLAALSLAGLPPLVGFLARLLSMEAALLSGWAWLLVVALVCTVIGAVAAARLVRALFAAAPDEDALPLDEPAPARAALTVCGVAVVGLAAAVQPLLALAGAGTAAVLPH